MLFFFLRLDTALRVVMEFPELPMEKSTKYGMCGLEMMVRRPFAFQSGSMLTWRQNLVYSFIQVNMTSSSVKPVAPAECTVRDEENPIPENLDCTKVEGSLNVSYKEIIMPYLTRVIGIKRLYNQRLMHQQAIALINQMLISVCKSSSLLWFLNDNPNIMKTAIKHGIT